MNKCQCTSYISDRGQAHECTSTTGQNLKTDQFSMKQNLILEDEKMTTKFAARTATGPVESDPESHNRYYNIN
jgi:hypothetical protein